MDALAIQLQYEITGFCIAMDIIALSIDVDLAEFENDNYDCLFEDEDEEYWEDDYDEWGYNPYLGCYDFDC